MNLIAESGSSKTDWLLYDTDQGISTVFTTSGYNPYVLGIDNLLKLLSVELFPNIKNNFIESVWFYGSGFSHPDYNLVLKQWFLENTQAKFVCIEHDLLGAARACCLNSPGLVAILGTGSNTCYYDGEKIVTSKGGHGYLFGDEGSGADLGKRLVKAVLDGELPDTLIQAVLKKTESDSPIALRNSIHGKPRPNVSLAALAPFVLELSVHKEVQSLIENAFRDFIRLTLARYPESRYLPVHFTGSIALYFADTLLPEMKKAGLITGSIFPRPLERLKLFHEKNN